MNHLSEKDLDLLASLLRAPRGASLKELASLLHTSPSLLSRNLKRLVGSGWVARDVIPTAAGREVHYRVLRGIDIRWVEADAGVALSWTAHEVDWEFPLVSRVADADARASIIGYLRALRGHHIHLGVAVIAIGSVVTGRVDRGSDVDLVVVMSDDQGPDVGERIEELAAQIGLLTPRAVQARVRSIEDIMDSDDIISAAVRAQGIVVYDSLRKPAGGKDERVMRRVEGRTP